LKGCSEYTTASGVSVLRLHYSADPARDPDTPDGLTWVQKQLKGYPGGMAGPKWQREMEINFSIRTSNKVFPNFADMQRWVACKPKDIPPHWPIWCGYDYGYTNPFAFVAVAFEGQDQCYQIDEIYMRGKSVWEQAKLIRERPYFDRIQGIIADPSIWRRDQQDGARMTSINELFGDHKIFMRKGDNYEKVDAAFIQLLSGSMWHDPGSPRFQIFDTCVNTLRELRNLHWKEWANAKSKINNPEYEKIYSRGVDAFDALKYVMLARWRGVIPDSIGVLPGSFDWYMQQIVDVADRKKYILA
jgi:hypothetical protein